MELPFWNWYDDEWMVGRNARRLFLLATFFVLSLTPLFLGALDDKEFNLTGRVVWGILGVLGTLSIFFLWIGMWRYWVSLDSSPRISRKVWFAVLLFGAVWGSCLYCYFVYLPGTKNSNTGFSA